MPHSKPTAVASQLIAAVGLPAAAASIGALSPAVVESWASGTTAPSEHESALLQLALDTFGLDVDETGRPSPELLAELDDLAARFYTPVA